MPAGTGRSKTVYIGPEMSPLAKTTSQLRTGAAPRALASFRNLTINTYRLAGRANIAYARRDLHDRADVFAVYGI
jgi:hypothetical protein